MPNGSTLIAALQPARPGDLIEADFFNKLIAAVHDLDQRIGGPQQPAGEEERHKFIIEELRLADRSEAEIELRVNGAGLEPSRLKAFYVNGFSIEAKAHGSDDAITVTADLRSGGDAIRRLGSTSRTAVPKLLILTLQNEAGETASGATEMT
jgi:hypothetical protein